jgi:hypothetical protein
MSMRSTTDISPMAAPIERCTTRYAVIEAMQTEGGHERFAISYMNEQSLRTLLASACIVGTGFLSREEALVACGRSMSVAA